MDESAWKKRGTQLASSRIGRDGLAGIPAADLRPGLTPGR
jgi:hypothetical protein